MSGYFICTCATGVRQVDLLKSAVDINHKASHQHLRKEGKASDQSLNSKRADSAPRLNQSKNISQPILSAVVDEVSWGWGLGGFGIFEDG